MGRSFSVRLAAPCGQGLSRVSAGGVVGAEIIAE